MAVLIISYRYPILLEQQPIKYFLAISYRIWYFKWANTGQPLLRCISASFASPHNLHIGDKSWFSIWCYIDFPSSACSCAAHTISSVCLYVPTSTIAMFSLCSLSLYLSRVEYIIPGIWHRITILWWGKISLLEPSKATLLVMVLR